MASILVCASCAGELDDVARFAPPMGDAGTLIFPDAGEGDDAGMDAGEMDDAGAMDAGEMDDAGTMDAGDQDDAGEMDAGDMDDAGEMDAGDMDDAGTMDAGEMDAGQDAGSDAGTHDAGTDAGSDAGTDAGTHDAGTDAGTDAGSDAGTDGGTHDGGTDAGTPDAGTCNALTTIITPSCATTFCHSNGASGMQAGLDLQSAGLPGRLIGDSATGGPGQIINRTSPDSSVLYTKTLKPPPYGSQMPLGGKALTTAQEACLQSWIHAAVGAP